MSKVYEVFLDKKEEEKTFEDAEQEFLSVRNKAVEKEVTKYTRLMVESKSPIMARWYQKKIQNLMPDYEEHRKETCYSR